MPTATDLFFETVAAADHVTWFWVTTWHPITLKRLESNAFLPGSEAQRSWPCPRAPCSHH